MSKLKIARRSAWSAMVCFCDRDEVSIEVFNDMDGTEQVWSLSTCGTRRVTAVIGLRKCEGIDGPERSRGCEETYVNVPGSCAKFPGRGLCSFHFFEPITHR